MSELPDRVWEVLRGHRTMVLATVDAGGQPEAAAVFFAVVDGAAPALVCTLLTSSAKLARIRDNPRVGFFIGPQAPTRWLQGSGLARVVEDDPERTQRTEQLIVATPEARVFVEQVPVTPVVITLHTVKLTDLTGSDPPVISIELT